MCSFESTTTSQGHVFFANVDTDPRLIEPPHSIDVDREKRSAERIANQLRVRPGLPVAGPCLAGHVQLPAALSSLYPSKQRPRWTLAASPTEIGAVIFPTRWRESTRMMF